MNPKYHLLIAVAALSLNACSTDDTCTEPENGGYKISFTVAEDTETRTTLEKLEAGNFMRWVSTDKVGIYTVGRYLNSNILTTADVSKSPVEFAGTLEQPVSPGELFYAYYPYKEGQPTDPSMVNLSIPEVQKQTKAGVYNGESNPLVAVPMGFSELWGSDACCMSNVRFRQLGAIVELQLYSSDETLCKESIHSVTFESYTPMAGNFSFDLSSVTVKDALPISGYESEVVTTSLKEPAAIPATKDGAARIYLTIAPGQYTGNIVVKTDVARYTFRLTKAMTFRRAAIKGLPADLAEAEREGPVVESDPIRFKDPTVKEICLAANWDTDGDGELSYKEAAAVTSIGLQFNKTSIRSFKEFRFFTGLESIENEAFRGCKDLTSITIPKRVTTIGDKAFYGCSSLTSIYIPESMYEIGDNAFELCISLMNIHIPEKVTKIGRLAFGSCPSLTSINIPNYMTKIEDLVFYDCGSLTSITIPEKVTSIGDQVFGNCSSLTNITIPEGVTLIGWNVFRGCSNLTSVYCKPTTPPTLGGNAFTDTPSSLKIYVPTTSVDAYKAANNWSTYASQIVAENN